MVIIFYGWVAVIESKNKVENRHSNSSNSLCFTIRCNNFGTVILTPVIIHTDVTVGKNSIINCCSIID